MIYLIILNPKYIIILDQTNYLAIWNLAVISFVELCKLCLKSIFLRAGNMFHGYAVCKELFCATVVLYWFIKPLKYNFCFHNDFVRFYFSELILQSFFNFTQQCGHFIDFRFFVYTNKMYETRLCKVHFWIDSISGGSEDIHVVETSGNELVNQ